MIKNISKIEEARKIIENMPYFTIEGLSSLDIKNYYLKIIIFRLKKNKEIISLKRGLYVSSFYLDKVKRENKWNDYLEFLSNIIYNPSYLSLEYVLNEQNILSESSFGFSLISTKKTSKVKNNLGNFYYYNIKKGLFTGFNLEKKRDFFIYKATVGKALFDFLYLRKNMVVNKDFFKSLRINREQITENDISNFKKYVDLEGSQKMNKIFKFLCNLK